MEHMSPRPSRRQIEFLLGELCVDLGFCLSPEAQIALILEPPSDVDQFTDAVIRAERLEPRVVPRHLRRDVRQRVEKCFSGDDRDA